MNRQIVLIVMICFFTACGTKKEIPNTNTTRLKSAKSLIKNIEKNNKSPNWLSLKGKISLDKEGQKLKFSTDVRIKKDSVIWMSIKAPFGIEIFRAQLTTDSIYFLNIPKSSYTKAHISSLYKHLKTEIDFIQIQQMLFGNINLPKAKYSFSEKDNNYKLSSKKRNKKTISFLVEKQDFRIVNANYYTSENEYFTFEINEYYKTEKNFLIPKKLKLDVKASDNFRSELNFTKIICNKEQKIHFAIPKNYVEIN